MEVDQSCADETARMDEEGRYGGLEVSAVRHSVLQE